jgi:hypothetical protein
LEMMASLSLLIVLSSFIFPQVIMILKEEKNIQIRHAAYMLLKEQVASYYTENVVSTTSVHMLKGVLYKVNWESFPTGHKERVCVSWHDRSQRPQERCIYVGKKE